MNECIAYLDSEGAWHPVPYEELIRCKDCKWYYGDYCGGFGDGSFTPEDGFCHNAERKEE